MQQPQSTQIPLRLDDECFKLKESFKQSFPGYNGHEVIRCKDCRYIGERTEYGYYTCRREEGCVETIPEGFCGWAVRRKDVE